MKPFDSLREAQLWILKNAVGHVEVLVIRKEWVLGGNFVDGFWEWF